MDVELFLLITGLTWLAIELVYIAYHSAKQRCYESKAWERLSDYAHDEAVCCDCSVIRIAVAASLPLVIQLAQLIK